jgi:hypothetical protein
MKTYYTQLEVAEAAQTSASYLSSCIRKGVVPGPTHQVGLRKYYEQDIRDRIVTLFEDRRRKQIISLELKQGGTACVREETQG